MLIPVQQFSSGPGSSGKWITITLIVILVAAIGFVGFAFYTTRKGPDQARTVATFTAPTPPAAPQYSCPLDGTIVASHDATTQRPIIVQIDNAPAARDQTGLSKADIIYEALAEGEITRFSAVYACHEADVVGPVRSARLIDFELVPEYQALLANSGASEGVSSLLQANPDIPNIDDNAYHDVAYKRTRDREAPHNLMTSTSAIREAASGAGFPITASLQMLPFKDDSPAPAVTNIEVNYSVWANVRYKYDAASNSWLRFNGDAPNKDTATGQQLAPKNVIVQFAPSFLSNIVEEQDGSHGMEYTLTGSGKVLVFRDGQVIQGIWVRANKGDVTQYLDAANKPIPLNRGLTFVQIVDTNFQPGWS